MAEINLLQNTSIGSSEERLPKIMNVIGMLLLAFAIVAYVLLWVGTSSAKTKTAELQAQQASIQEKVQQSEDYPKLSNYQNKLKNVQLLLDKHLSWGTLIQRFSDATLKTATYKKFTANSDGSATITGTVPDFQNLDKLIKAFQLNEFQYIKDVKLVNVGLSEESKNGISFTVNVIFNNTILQAVPTPTETPTQTEVPPINIIPQEVPAETAPQTNLTPQ
ncbi:MAG: hypothetical protein ACYC5G_00930 [Candidatus Doudnabacteria bacterium]